MREYPLGMGHCALGALFVKSDAMGLLTFGLNVTLDGCIDHTQGIADDELLDYWTQLMDQSGAMLFGRNTYELMEGADQVFWRVVESFTLPRARGPLALRTVTLCAGGCCGRSARAGVRVG